MKLKFLRVIIFNRNLPFLTLIAFPECERRTCLTATPPVAAECPPPGALTWWCSDNKNECWPGDFGPGDFGDDDRDNDDITSAFWEAIFSISLCSSVRKPSLLAIFYSSRQSPIQKLAINYTNNHDTITTEDSFQMLYSNLHTFTKQVLDSVPYLSTAQQNSSVLGSDLEPREEM